MVPRNDPLDLAGLQRRLREVAAERNWERFHTPKNLAMALGVEVAELTEIFQWMTPEESGSLDDARSAAVADELADVMIYLARLADVTGIDLGVAVALKLERDGGRSPGERGWADST